MEVLSEMNKFYHRTNNLDKILSSGRIKALKHIALSDPDAEIEVEHGSRGSNLGGTYSNRLSMKASDAYNLLKERKDVNNVFVTKEVLPPTSYGKYVIEKSLKSPTLNDRLNLISNEYISNRALSVNSNANVYVPDDEHEGLTQMYSGVNFIPMSQLNARKATLVDLARTLHGKLTKSAYDINTLYSGTENDIRKALSPNATIVGSEGIGINLAGSSDRDILIPYKTRKGYERLVNRLTSSDFGLKESPYNNRKRDGYKVYSYKDGNVDVDVAVVHQGKAIDLANHVRKLRTELSDEDKKRIIAEKERLSNAWILKDYRYKKYKRSIDEKLGLTQFHE